MPNEGDVMPAIERCSRPPEGWECSRRAGHDGPCAATPTFEEGSSAWDEAVDALIEQFHAPEDYAQRVVKAVVEAMYRAR